MQPWLGFGADSSMSAQLAVLAAAAVVSAEPLDFTIVSVLTLHAQSDAWYRVAPRLRNRCPATRTVRSAGTIRQPTFGAQDSVLDGCIDLFLNRAFARPPSCHIHLPPHTSTLRDS
jgi:hypothetical protein